MVARRSEAGEAEVLSYMREAAAGVRGRVIFHGRAVAQELGWPAEDAEFVMLRLVEKGAIESYGGGYSLTGGAGRMN